MSSNRGNWSSSLGFILAATGSAIGLGNLWKFPYITWHNEGGSFVLIYLVCIAVVGLPIMLAEVLIGRKTQKGPVGALKEAVGPRWGIVGRWGVLGGFTILSFYTVVAGWSIRYFIKTMSWTLGEYPSGFEGSADFGTFAADSGSQLLFSLLFTTATVFVVLSGVRGGIERVAKTLLPALFGILILLLFSALSMEGSAEALSFIFVPSPDSISAGAVLEALGHSFFTLSLGMGAMITYGSYVARDQSLVKAGGIIVLLDTVIALFATIIMFSVIFSVPGMRDEIGASAVGMLFIALPTLFYTVVPFGTVLAPLFYILVAFAALTSTISLLEVVVSYFIDERKWSRRKATLFAGSTIFVITIFCALSLGAVESLSSFELFEGKAGVFSTLDHFAANWVLPTGGFLITIAAGWFMTRESTRAELELHAPSWFRFEWWYFFIRFVAPAAVAAILIAVVFFQIDFS